MQRMVNKKLFMSRDLIKHCNDVKCTAEYLCHKLDIEGTDKQHLLRAAEIHDIGKYYIPNEILNACRSLSPEERKIIDMHALYGFIKSVECGEDPIVSQLILMHHGYRVTRTVLKTQGLICDNSVLSLYPILIASDIYNAMISDRVYRKACTPEVALTIVSENEEVPRYVIDALSTYR